MTWLVPFSRIIPKSPRGFEANEIPVNPDDDFIISRTRDNLQILINELWSLETERVEDAIVVVLPPPISKIPREKPVPKEKALTKWESYAKTKGIVKKKKSRLKAQAEVKKTWVMELKGNAPDSEDPFEKAAEEKRERIAKNEIHRLRNLARAKNVKIPSVREAVLPKTAARKSSAQELSRAAELAQKSTASLGKFQEKLSSKVEKNDRSLSILDKMNNKKSQLNVSKAVGKQIHAEETERSASKKTSGKGGKKGGKRGTYTSKARRGGSVGGKRGGKR
ncbi:RRS1 [Lepeophtheirus salmonis]|uniref:Ribosome biogenesis regulatory protein n=1 Tax=Lepeophtheirus salmonis TaxID=72036 RepID=A0A7R8CSG0_LEPSM|nr:RRS1 [Lepeophtheirus salmonis]CAF2916677.1 RRS1 [Lepeophtheirus salmonis]